MDPDPWADVPASAGGSSQPSQPASANEEGGASQPAAPSSGSKPTRLTPRRLVAQPTRLQAVEDDPLGPLSASAPSDNGLPLGGSEAPPVPPVKEQLPLRTTMPASVNTARRAGPADPHRIDDDEEEDGLDRPAGPRQPPPVLPAQPSPVRTSTQPSVSIEQAAKPTFQITVGDPQKIGDLTSSHIVYSVRTRVSLCGWEVYSVGVNRTC
jgi:sorting nexin-1/2